MTSSEHVAADSRVSGSAGDGSSASGGRRGGRALKWLVWLLTLLLLFLAIVFIVKGLNRSPASPVVPGRSLANVETMTVRAVEHIEVLELPARILADRTAVISAEVPGLLSSWEVGEGEEVAANQVVARLDRSILDAELAELAARLAASEAERDYAEREYERVQPLAKSGAAREADLDAARIAFTRARLEVQRMQRQMALLEVQLAKTILRAPIRGRLEEHLFEAGEVIATGEVLARLYDSSQVRAVVNVPDRYVPFLDALNPAVQEYVRTTMPGAEQFVRSSIMLSGLPKLTGAAYSGLELSAAIGRVAQAAEVQSNTFEVELRLANPGEALKQGMIVQARISYLRYPSAVLIPLQAVQVAESGPRVLVVRREGAADIAVVREIEPVSIKQDQVLVGDNLLPGERLIVAGGKGVISGEEVQVVMEDGVLQLPTVSGVAPSSSPEGNATATEGEKDAGD